MHTFVDEKLKEAHSKVGSIKILGLKSPRAAHRLLTCCASKLMSYLSSTVPPHIMLPSLRTFDGFIQAAFFDILSSTPIICSEDRMFRAKLKLSLPTPAGCGLFKAATQGLFAWWASVSLCLSDQLLFTLRAGLERFAVPAWDSMLDALGGNGSRLWTQVKHLLPANSQGLTDGTHYSPLMSTRARCAQLRLSSYHQIISNVSDHLLRLTSFQMTDASPHRM